jgi:rhodanese-related sulfurtransferase
MTNYDFEQAKGFFKAKASFTTGLHEVDGMIKSNQDIVIVDVRLPRDYGQRHVPGAINLPNGRWHKPTGLSRNKLNILYCYSQTCHLAAEAAVELLAQGYPVVEMEGGFAGWEEAGYEVETAPTKSATALG